MLVSNLLMIANITIFNIQKYIVT